MTTDEHALGQFQSRRRFLQETACGLGTFALWQLMANEACAKPHFAPRAKNIIFLFMPGAPSQLDLMDPKPAMQKYHGQPVPAHMLDGLDDGLIRGSARIFASPRTFRQYGQSGMAYSDYIPHHGKIADDICLIRSMHTDIANHTPAQLLMNCGLPIFGHPSMGSWVSYGLGSENQNLPGFVVMTSNSGSGIDAGTANWSSGFLPSEHRGVTFRASADPVLHLRSPKGVSVASQRARLDAIGDLNRIHQTKVGDPEIASRIAAYEMAYRMQTEAQEVFDLGKETKETRSSYGPGQFADACLAARRLVESGVRMVQVYYGDGQPWDDHTNIKAHADKAKHVDQPIAALLKDLKARDLLKDTLIIWGGEFGRTPVAENGSGRDHNHHGFTMWLAGGGVKGGMTYGSSDEFGFAAVENKVHVHDLHATILHLMGLDHEKLTFRYSGRDFRLTDVHGTVVKSILA